jgi:exonuclease VII large subunit
MKIKPIKVSVLNQYIKKYLMGNSILNNLRVEGEISNIRMSKTGYTYFSLCDESSCISCVAFFADTISKNGDKIIAEGELSVYEAKGTYQLIVRNIERVGLGKILLDLELLKEKLRSQGLFDRKRDLPPYPHKIGIITSKTGAGDAFMAALVYCHLMNTGIDEAARLATAASAIAISHENTINPNMSKELINLKVKELNYHERVFKY